MNEIDLGNKPRKPRPSGEGRWLRLGGYGGVERALLLVQVHGTIEQLVAEEHELWEREAAGNASDADRQRLQQVKVSLDQCWTCSDNGAPCGKLGATRTRLT